jgi:2-hydroxychromene-2-carboxylate isomerase
MTPQLDFYYSFRSPYSYLAAPRAFALPERFDVQLDFRGVIPMAMRGQAVPRAKRLHTLRDAAREATRLGMPFGRIHDPIGDGAMRCLLVGELAREVGRAREFVLEAGRCIWSEAADVSRDPALRQVCERAGLDWDRCVAALDDEAALARVRANTDALVKLGHWGVPVFVFGDELFWGQDRIEDVETALRRAGLER